MPRFTGSAAAQRDLSEIWDFIAEDNEAAADRTVREIDARCALLAEHPKMARDRSEIVSGVPSFPVGSNLIFYHGTAQANEIIRVLHGAGNLDIIEFEYYPAEH